MTKTWDGQEAVELFRNSEPGEFDVILMDIMMPVMNGYEATKMIRSLDREDAKKIPIIAMAAIYEKALKNHYIEILYIDFEDTHALCIWQYR